MLFKQWYICSLPVVASTAGAVEFTEKTKNLPRADFIDKYAHLSYIIYTHWELAHRQKFPFFS